MKAFDFFLAITASAMMVAGFVGWFEYRKAHSLPLTTLPSNVTDRSYHPVCNFQYPYGFAPHRIRFNWEPTAT